MDKNIENDINKIDETKKSSHKEKKDILKSFVENNPKIKEFCGFPKEELQIIRMYINLNLVQINRKKDKEPTILTVKSCLNETYNYFDYILSFRYKVDTPFAMTEDTLSRVKEFRVCDNGKCKKCVKTSLAILLDEIDTYNANNNDKISYLDVIDFILKRKTPVFKEIAEESLFKNIDLFDLMHIQIILEADLISLYQFDEDTSIAEFKYLDVTQKEANDYYINKLLNYYKNAKNSTNLVLNLTDTKNIFDEKELFARIYKIAAYYKYLMEHEKINILSKLREILDNDAIRQGLKIRVHYFIYKYFKKVDALPYSDKTKEKIYSILNYILSYRYKKQIPYVPINILMYSNDKAAVINISKIIGEFMWFFGYLSDKMRYYDEYINNIILDKFAIKKLYADGEKSKNGVLVLHNFENLLYTDYLQQNLTLNILTDEMEKNNNNVCTIIYGERKNMKHILGNHHKLSQLLINLELEIDDLEVDKIYELVIAKLEKVISISDAAKEKIYNYIHATYRQSEIQNIEYVDKLHHQIILNMNKKFLLNQKEELKEQAVPEAYNTRDLPTIMKDLNSLVGLKEIKEQIKDLVALLKFNKKANLDIKKFNLHMVFKGNSGTGKTTVARLITDIFYNLGYINQNKLTEVTAKDLIAEYIGQTSGKTFKVVKSALGGVLFIDEAYSITSSNDSYGDECIATLLKLMEDYRDKFVIIFAGYNEEMEQFQKSNSGLVSRIGYTIDFPDYTIDELTKIYLNLLAENKLQITDEALNKLKNVIQKSSHSKNFGNARYIHTVFQKVLIEHSKNIESQNEKTNLYLISEEDIIPEKLIVNDKKKTIGF